MTRHDSRPIATAFLTLAFAGTLAACSGHDVKRDGPLRVTNAWVRAANVSGTGAFYADLENTDTVGVTIVGAGTFSAEAAEFHQTTDVQGTAQMTRLDSLPIARGATLTMKPGGLHVMLINAKQSFAAGDTVSLTFHLADGRTTSVKAIARDEEK